MPGTVNQTAHKDQTAHQERTPAQAGVRSRLARPAGLISGLAVLCLAAIVGVTISSEGRGTAAKPTPVAAAQTTIGSTTGSPAERRIAEARTAVDLHPKRVDGWNQLAMALARRARETGNPGYYAEAWQATERALALEPGHFEARKNQVWILLGQHEFPRAVREAEALNKQMPDDVMVYGFLVDGYTELGRYADAEKAAQWMLDMRPGNVPGLTRAAHLRELFGDHDGSVELMDAAYRRIADGEIEDRAWILTQIAHLSLLRCRTEAADRLLDEALKIFPEYHYALARLAELRTLQGRFADAAGVRERHVAAAPHPENRFELGLALLRAGRADEARQVWKQFEGDARKEMDGWDSANVELIDYYADHAGRSDEALRLAKREAARRQDVRTLEALAWALHRDGQSASAREEIDKVLAVGVADPRTFARAAAIAAAQGDEVHAREWADRSLSMCRNAPASAEARAVQSQLSSR